MVNKYQAVKKYLAQCIKVAGEDICGPTSFMGGKSDVTLGDIIGQILKFLYPIAGLILFFFLFWGGFDYLTSAGNPEKIKAGQGKITTAVIGFILLMISYLAARLIAAIFNLGEGIL